MPLNRLERYFEDYTYIRKGHYPVTDLIVYVYMGDAWTEANKAHQIAISEGLLRSIEAKRFELGREGVERLFELYDLKGKAERGELSDVVMLQTSFTQIIEMHHLSNQSAS